MGGSAKGAGPDSGFLDYVFNPIGAVTGKLFGIEFDPIGSAAASQATNVFDMLKGDEPTRMWGGDSWIGDMVAPAVGQESRMEQIRNEQLSNRRQAEHDLFRRRYMPEAEGGSLLTDDEEE